MKTIGFGRYGPPEVLEFRDIGMPVVRGDEVPIRVRTVPANLLDWHFMVGAVAALSLTAGSAGPVRRP
jgi:NADPH:quinone reductase-like Zn-dependent oxidoreductase